MPTPILRQVRASAGSGKTFDLTRRFLEHLAVMPQTAYGYPSTTPAWGDIIAATFTNSAAAEMKERLIRRLKESALGLVHDSPLQAAHAALWVDIIVRQYGALNIRTLDSLLHLIVRTAALDLGLPPDFTPAFTTEETLTPVLEDCLERAWQGDTYLLGLLRDACESLIFHNKTQGFAIGERLNRALLPVIEAHYMGLCGDLASTEELQARYDTFTHECATATRAVLAYVKREGLLLNKNAVNAFVRAVKGDPQTPATYLSKDALDTCLVSKSPPPSVAAHAAYRTLTTAFGALTGQGEILRRAIALAPFVALARALRTGLDTLLQREGLIPGQLLPLLARQILDAENGVPTTLCRLASGLRHILIDEFQDTSRAQWLALYPLIEEALACGGSLTVLGDVKQSIYAWRGGDPALFDEVSCDAGLRAIAPTSEQYTLKVNWRSRTHIVATNNALFAPLAQPDTAREALLPLMGNDCPKNILHQTARDIAQSFADVVQTPKDGATGGYVTICRVEAENIAALSEAVCTALRERLVEDIAQRRAFGDVCILTRTNPEASQTASWLMEWGVPVITENSLLLNEHPLILQTLAFLQFLDSPQDDIALWQVLTGSVFAPLARLCGAYLDTLHNTAAARESSLYACVQADFPEVYQWCLAPFLHRADVISPYDTVREWYRLLRVEERFPEARTFVRRLFEVIHTAAGQGHGTLGTFLDYWQRSGGDEKAPMPPQTDAVRVMTIHKAKGLQFPVVIVPWTCFTLKNDAQPVLYELDGLRMLAPRCAAMGAEYFEAQASEAREVLHVAYVALTRPQDELHILHTKASTQNKRNFASALDTLFAAAGIDLPYTAGVPTPVSTSGEKTWIATQATPARNDTGVGSCHCEEREARRGNLSSSLSLPEDNWRPMNWLPRLQIYRHPLRELGFTATRRGLLMHHCLECLRWTGQAQDDARRAVREGIRTFVLPVAPAVDADRVVHDLIEALMWFAALPQAQTWLERGLPEHSLLDAQGKIHRVDLLVPPDATRGWTALEYKTGVPEDIHTHQLRRYLALLDSLTEENTPKPVGILIYLDQRVCHTVTRTGDSVLTQTPKYTPQYTMVT